LYGVTGQFEKGRMKVENSVFILGIPLFMFIVLKSLKRIEKRLESLENTHEIKKEQ